MGVGSRVSCLGVRVVCFGIRDSGFGFLVSGFGFRDSSLDQAEEGAERLGGVHDEVGHEAAVRLPPVRRCDRHYYTIKTITT